MKKYILLLLVGCLACASLGALGQGDYPSMLPPKAETPTMDSLLQADTTYTLTSHEQPAIASQAYADAHPDMEIGLESDVRFKPATGAQLAGLDLQVLQASEDGHSALLMKDDFLFTKRGEQLHMLAFHIEKSGGSYQAWEYYLEPPVRPMGTEGVVFSPDGRYMVLPHAMRVLDNMTSNPLMVLDGEKGEIYAIRSYDDASATPPIPSYFQAVFSQDGTQLYYTEMVEDTLRLCQYTFETDSHQTLLDTKETLFGWPGIILKDDGTLQCYVSETGDNYLATFSVENGQYTLAKEKLPGDFAPDILRGTR